MEFGTDSVGKHDSNKDQAAAAHDALLNSLVLKELNEKGIPNTPELAPNSAAARLGLVTFKGLAHVPEGMLNAVVHDFKNPLETAETLGSAAGMAFVLKTVLPESGMAGKIASAAIGAYFTYRAAEPIIDSYKKANNAQTMDQLDLASRQFGDAGGSFVVNSAVAAVGYKAGSMVTDRWLSSASMDGFADAKVKFYDQLSESSTAMTDRIGITTPKGSPQIFEANSANPRVRVEGSERQAPTGNITGEVDPNAPMEVSVMLKSKGSDLRMDRTLARIAQGRQAPLNDTDFSKTFGATKESLDAVSKFANDYGINVTESDLISGRVVLSGKTEQFSKAFETKLSQYEDNGVVFRGREGALTIPKEIAPHIANVLGVDDRPQARAHVVFLDDIANDRPQSIVGKAEAADGPAPTDPPPPIEPGGKKVRGYYPNEVADAYNYPKNTTGKGQAVGIVELGGGLDKADNAKYYQDRNLPEPKINVIEIGNAKNKPGVNSRFDGEVALDSQVIGTVAPEATQNLIFAPNNDKGFIDGVTRGTFAQEGEMQNSSISISWGGPEEMWSQQAIEGMGLAVKKAALKGISVFAASGDDGALDRARSGKWQADFPASNPGVTGAGGTRLTIENGARKDEVAWNNHRQDDATGGGVSQVYPVQDFQKDAKVPLNATTQLPGRGVPDIAANADPLTGYRIRVGGNETITGGTSAVAPLYSALMMRVNEALGKPVSNLNPWLYKNTGIFNDIVLGDNNAYKAGPGWDAVTGWGSIDGTKMLEALKANPTVPANFGEFKFVGPSQIQVASGTDGSQQGR